MKAQLEQNYGKRSVFTKILIVSFLLSFINISTIGSMTNAYLATAQYFFVIYLLVMKKTSKALLWHLLFIATSLSVVGAHGLSDDDTVFLKIYNYSNIKLIGPIGYSYVITILILIVSLLSKKQQTVSKESPFYKMYRALLFMAISGDILGILGLVFSDYFMSTFISYNRYIWMVIITIKCLLLNLSEERRKQYFYYAIPVLCGCIFSSFVLNMLGLATSYGGVKGVAYIADICMHSFILLFVLISKSKHKTVAAIALLAYCFLLTTGAAGKTYFMLASAIVIMCGMSLFSKEYKYRHPALARVVSILSITAIVCTIVYIPAYVYQNNEVNVSSIKLKQALSVFDGDFSNIAESPAIRIGETANFVYNNRFDPIHLAFGNGYGGYFTDELHIFNNFSLSGAWPIEIIMGKKFPSAHDTLSTVPLLNGIVGLILILYICWLYIKRISKNYLSLAAVTWLLFIFYFTPSMAFTALFFIAGAEYDPQNA